MSKNLHLNVAVFKHMACFFVIKKQDNKNKTNTKPIRNDFRNNLINFPAQFVKRPKTDGEFAQGSNSVQIKQEDGFPASSTAVKQESFPFSVVRNELFVLVYSFLFPRLSLFVYT